MENEYYPHTIGTCVQIAVYLKISQTHWSSSLVSTRKISDLNTAFIKF
jgi:hypothetical protein